MSKTKVRNAIAREMAARSRRTGITQDRVLRELARVAFVNPSDVINFDTGTVKENAGADDLAAVSSCKVKTMSMQSAKLTEINAACDAAITAGCDVTLSDGTAGHISLSIPDQINLSTAQEAIKAGGTGYAYHLDGALCEVYPAADIAIMAKAATAHVLYHQTYCNHEPRFA